MRLGFRLKHYRDTYGLTQEQVARKVGITPAQLSRIERGKKVDEKAIYRLNRFFDTKFIMAPCFTCKYSGMVKYTGYMDDPTDKGSPAIPEFKMFTCYYSGALTSRHNLCDKYTKKEIKNG